MTPTPFGARPSQARILAIVNAIGQEANVTPEAIRSDSRETIATAARWLAWRQLHARDGFGLAPIAKAWGCHHTSIMYARDRNWLSPYGSAPLLLAEDKQRAYEAHREEWAESIGRSYPERQIYNGSDR